MLYPQSNCRRTVLNLSGFWKFKIDRDQEGEEKGWSRFLKEDFEIAVPASWNEQLEEVGLMNYIGSVWYQRDFFLSEDFIQKRIWLRIGSADYRAKVWINEKFVGEHEGGFLPFEFDVTQYIKFGKKNIVTILVNNQLHDDSIPQGTAIEEYQVIGRPTDETFPATRFDFFPYGGIHRPVLLYATAEKCISDITVKSAMDGALNYVVEINGEATGVVSATLEGAEASLFNRHELRENRVEGHFKIPDCRFWSPEDPFLYNLVIQLEESGKLIDEYRLPVGLRVVEVQDGKLLLNGKPIFLRGFGKHEDFPVLGKGLNHTLIIKDFSLLKWCHANSFRTSHYPYSEEMMYMADRHGFLVIDEVPAVSLYFKKVNRQTLAHHKQAIKELIARDKNHPCVILWSLANEAGLWGESEYQSEQADAYFKEICQFARSLDTTIPVTIANCQRAGVNDVALKHCDVISINRYFGWYENPAQLDLACKRLSDVLDSMYNLYRKPIMVTEFGASAIAGLHSTSPQLFTEEYQSELIRRYCKVIESKPFTVGEHVWNFADFRTPQSHRRVVLNCKGVFNRERQPKKAAFLLRKMWGGGERD